MSNYLQNNAGNNYSLYYNVLDYFRTIMNNHPTIAQVSQGDIFQIDDNQFTLYPLGNVQILGAQFDPTTTNYDIQIIVADKIKENNLKCGLKLLNYNNNINEQFHQNIMKNDLLHDKMKVSDYDIEIYKLERKFEKYSNISQDNELKIGYSELKYELLNIEEKQNFTIIKVDI